MVARSLGLVLDAVELGDQAIERVGFDEMRIVELVLAVEEMIDLGVEDLPRQMVRLLQHGPAELGVGIVAEVLAFVDEPLALRVDHDAEEVADLAIVLPLEVGQVEIAVVRRMQVHGRGVTALVEPVALGAELERHLQALAGVVGRSTHFGLGPVLADEAGPQLGIGFEAAAAEDDGTGLQVLGLACRVLGPNTGDPSVLDDQVDGAAVVADLTAQPGEGLELRIDEPHTLVPGGKRQPAPEDVLAVLLERLPRIDRLELHFVRGKPADDIVALRR